MGKKNKRLSAENAIELDGDNDVPYDKITDWSEENSKQLLEIVAEMSKSHENLPYNTAIKMLDYDEIAKQLNNRTAAECKLHLEFLIGNIRKVKSMYQVVNEAMEHPRKPLKAHMKTSYMVFCEEKLGEATTLAKEKGESNFKIFSTLWSELSEEEKQVYKAKATEQNEKMQGSKNEFENPVRSPFEFYLEKCRKKDPKFNYLQARTCYVKMDLSKKLKFIIKSFKTLHLEEQALKDHYTLHPNEKEIRTSKLKYHYPTIEEAKYYYQQLEMPKEPTKHLPIYFYKESNQQNGLECARLLPLANQAFLRLSKKKQEHWKNKYEKVWEIYKSEFNEWSSKQDPLDIKLLEKLFPGPKAVKKSSVKKSYMPKLKEISMPIGNMKFVDEPKFPSFNPLTVYDNFLKGSGETVDKVTLRRKFSLLETDELNNIKMKAKNIRERFIKTIREFVDSLTEDMRKLYLGQRRMKIISHLKEDIFENSYPNEDYPVYAKMLGSAKVAPTKKITNNEVESNDINESEISTSKKKRKLLPVESDILNATPKSGISHKAKKKKILTSLDYDSEAKNNSESPTKTSKKRRNSSSSSSESVLKTSWQETSLEVGDKVKKKNGKRNSLTEDSVKTKKQKLKKKNSSDVNSFDSSNILEATLQNMKNEDSSQSDDKDSEMEDNLEPSPQKGARIASSIGASALVDTRTLKLAKKQKQKKSSKLQNVDESFDNSLLELTPPKIKNKVSSQSSDSDSESEKVMRQSPTKNKNVKMQKKKSSVVKKEEEMEFHDEAIDPEDEDEITDAWHSTPYQRYSHKSSSSEESD